MMRYNKWISFRSAHFKRVAKIDKFLRLTSAHSNILRKYSRFVLVIGAIGFVLLSCTHLERPACNRDFSREEKLDSSLVAEKKLNVYIVSLLDSGNKEMDAGSLRRRNKLISQLDAQKVAYEVFPATYGEHYLDPKHNKNNIVLELTGKKDAIQVFGESGQYSYRFTGKNPHYSWKELGQRLTYFRLFQKISSELAPALVLEDNAVIDEFLLAKVASLLTYRPSRAGVIYPYCSYPYGHTRMGGRFVQPNNGKLLTNVAQIIYPDVAAVLFPRMLPFDDTSIEEWLAGNFPPDLPPICACPSFIRPNPALISPMD